MHRLKQFRGGNISSLCYASCLIRYALDADYVCNTLLLLKIENGYISRFFHGLIMLDYLLLKLPLTGITFSSDFSQESYPQKV